MEDVQKQELEKALTDALQTVLQDDMNFEQRASLFSFAIQVLMALTELRIKPRIESETMTNQAGEDIILSKAVLGLIEVEKPAAPTPRPAIKANTQSTTKDGS